MLSAAVLSLSFLTSPASAQEGVSDGLPDAYVIQRGDTLWDISTRILGNPYYWPKLWSINEYITNPHWIYPGNTLVFQLGSVIEPPSVDIGEGDDGYQGPGYGFAMSEPGCGPDIHFDRTYDALTYDTPGFLEKRRDVENLGKVIAAKTGQTKLGEGDLVYLELDEDQSYECGDLLMVYRDRGKVRDPKRWFKTYGSMHEVMAELVVVHQEGDTTSAVVRNSYASFDRGDEVMESFPVSARLAVKIPQGELEGRIIAKLRDYTRLTAVGDVVFLDLGRGDGVQTGSTFYIVHRRDEGQDILGYDEDIPAQVVGRVLVTEVKEETSTAVIVDAARNIRIGDDIAMSID